MANIKGGATKTKSGRRFYNSVAWRKVRAIHLRHHSWCCMREAEGRRVAGNQVDHIQSMKSGGAALDLANLQTLCASCHSRKTAHLDGAFGRERGDRVPVKGCGSDGMPNDPEHPWFNG